MPWKTIADGGSVYVPEYRVEPYGFGYEPQMLYQVAGNEMWLPLNEDGYILEPDLWNQPQPTISQHSELTQEMAQRAVTCARRINDEQIIRNVPLCPPEEQQP